MYNALQIEEERDIIMCDVFRHHDLLDNIIHVCGPQFISHF